MNAIHILWCGAAWTALSACSTSVASSRSGSEHTAGGTLPATNVIRIDVGVADVKLVVEQRDSVAWSLETKPGGCATADATPGRLVLSRRHRHCSTRWRIRLPIIDDVRVNASVGDVEATAPANRAVRLRSSVGSVRLAIDGRELRHGRSPGSGDRLELGDLSSLPRFDVETGVGSIRAELHTPRQAQTPR